MNKPSLTRVICRRFIPLALLTLAWGGLLGGNRYFNTAQAQSVVTCVVGEGDTCAAGPAHIVALLGESFVVEIRVEDFVDADDDGDTLGEGLGGFQFSLDYDPDVVSVSSVSDPAEVQALFLGSTGRTVTCVDPLVGMSFVQLACGTLGSSPLGPTGSGVVARVTFLPGAQADVSTELIVSTILADLPGNAQPHTDQGATVTVLDPLADSDGDGCSNQEELGSNPALGGQRDPDNFWDFYDVPVPSHYASGGGGTRDKAIGVTTDVVALLTYVGSQNTGSDPRYNVDLDGDGIQDGIEYDRRTSAYPSQPWRSGPPDGGIGITTDVVAMMKQGGHSCTAPP